MTLIRKMIWYRWKINYPLFTISFLTLMYGIITSPYNPIGYIGMVMTVLTVFLTMYLSNQYLKAPYPQRRTKEYWFK